ncbi:DUF3326 domain-containing protein [bacterium]|nr:DUF3326 domain-containing protein [bacterium]
MINLCEKQTAAFVVPTGVGASIGGFAGDASSWARKFAKEMNLIVNPNVVNAACFSGITDNMMYVEGWTLNQFFRGNINLKPSLENKIGIIFDCAIPENIMNVHINTINAVKTVYGIEIADIEITKEPCGVEFFLTESGISSGSLNNPQTLLEAGQKLLKKGASALAVVTLFDDPDEDDGYSQGEAVDIVGGVEAIISHYLSSELFVPVAHAPAFVDNEISEEIVDPRASAEYITSTFLPCILLGLQQAPQLSEKSDNGLNCKDISALIVPYNCLGSSIVFDCIKNNVKVCAIKENSTVLNIDKNALNIQNSIIEFKDYNECLEFLKNQQHL